MVDPDLELKGGGGSFVLLSLPAFLPSVISSFFLPSPFPRSANDKLSIYQ